MILFSISFNTKNKMKIIKKINRKDVCEWIAEI